MVETTARRATITLPSDREILITREFDAPRALVFEVFSRPEHLVKWWGCFNATVPVCEIDLRPGGAYRFVMRMPDGSEHPFIGVHREVVPPERLVYTQIYDVAPFNQAEAVITATFTEKDGKTLLTSHSVYSSPEARDGHLQSGMETGMNDAYGRIDDLLVSESDRSILLSRVFRAPRELVFDAWTQPEKVAKWWGPRGFTTTIHHADVRTGGTLSLTMHGPDGIDYPNVMTYQDVVPPERIAYTNRGGRKGDESFNFDAVITFAPLNGQTELTMRLIFDTPALRARIIQEFGALEGGKQHLERLMEHLENSLIQGG